MFYIGVRGQDKVKQLLRKAPGQVRFATALALTRTGQDVRKAEYADMRRVFDRPTPYTMRALYLRPATKDRLESIVWFKGKEGKGTAAERYLLPQVYGGTRPDKRSEVLLRQAGYIGASEQVVPASGAKLDAYGNVARGFLQRVLSGVRAQFDPLQRRTSSRRSRRNTGMFFVSRGDRLPRGIWERVSVDRVIPVFLFTGPHRYRRRFDFFGIAERVARMRWPIQIERAAAYALRTAR